MVLLNCALVGEGSVISIIIEEWKTVALLKKVIAEDQKYDFAASKLQLFLAKKDGAWLDGAGAAAVALDEHGHPQGFEQMDPILWIKNAKYFGERFQPDEGQIHVLVVVPEQDNLRSPAMALLEVMLPHMLTNAPTTLTERNRDFKDRLCKFYGCYRRKKSWGGGMLLDVAFPKSLVIASHLFRRNNEYLSFVMMQISDIDDVKNGLMLFKPLEHALDYFQISFIRDDTGAFRLKLFDPDIGNTRLIDLTDRNGNRVLSSEQTSAPPQRIVEEKRCCFDEQTTFGDVDGNTLTFAGLERPFFRCLNLQARVARMIALNKKWIDASYDFTDFWSEVSLDDKMEMFHRSILNADVMF